MQRNRSVPAAEVIPVLVYPDVRAAVDWLEQALGFTERVRIGEAHRAQLTLGSAALIVGDVRGHRVAPQGDGAAHSVVLRVDDVRAVCERAREHGATMVSEPQDHEYGERQCEIRDPFGHHFTLSQTLRDMRPEEWGGQTVNGGHPVDR